MSAMIDMAKTPDDVKDEEKSWASPVGIATMTEKYPWGLSISLNQKSLEKLGLDGSMPTVGTIVKFSAEARVTSVSATENENAGGESKQCKSVELQIVRMALPADEAKAEADRANRWYGAGSSSDDE